MIPSVRKRQYRLSGGFTLVEMLTVVTIAAIMMVIAVPNITSMVRNASMTNARNLVKTALSQAQSYAVRNGVHAGIRFQKAANGKTYLVLIE
ncbi:MAG: prepilin-type N-terminal cleavage/methylation domain-containing protein, partial [Sedimentisphaerales bacterium]|nr:prepilin-type N-terminal cleavage/methylation domain-containing protein [Sedimentisphaerales bacterium]